MGKCASKIVFNVGKQALKQIIEPIPTTKVEYITVNECTGESCMFYKSEDEYAKLYCSKFCPKAQVVKPIVKRVINLDSYRGPILNAKNKFIRTGIYNDTLMRIKSLIAERKLPIKSEIRLSCLQMKQMLALYSLCDSNGIIKSISKKELASFIGCSEKSIENNFDLLSKTGFLSVFPREKGELSIIINNYKEQHKKNGKGYIVMSSEMLSILMKLTNVNAVRIAIQAIIKNDMNSVVSHATKFSIKEIRRLLPGYIYTYKAINKIIEAFKVLGQEVFKWTEKDKVFIVDIDKALDGKVIKQESSATFETEIIDAITEKYADIENTTKDTVKGKLSTDIEDLVAMSFEFGVSVVKSFALEAFAVKETIRSFGAYVRQLICNFYAENGNFDLA